MTLLLAIAVSAAVSGAPVETEALREKARTLTVAGKWDEALSALASATKGVPPSDTRTLAFLETERGRVLADRNFFHREDPGPAHAALEEARRLAEASGDARVLSEARMQLARLDYSAAFETKDWKTPRAAFESVLATREKIGDRRGASESLFYLGLTYEQDGQPDAAMERYLRGLAIAEKDGDIILESYLRRHIGGIQEERGELAAAGKNIDLEIALRKKGGFVVGVPFALRQKADFVLAHGAGRAEAMKILEEAIAVAQSCGSTRGLYLARVDLSRLALESGDQARAVRLAEQAVEAARAFGGAPALREASKQLDAARKGPVGTR